MKLSHWPLYVCAPLLGLSQAILLVYTPFLLDKTQFTLATLSLIMTFGSMLFLFSTPMWARLSCLWGYKRVLASGLLGFSFSFFIIFLLVWLVEGENNSSLLWVVGLICARIIYGLTAAAIVPTCQAWLADINHNINQGALIHTVKEACQKSVNDEVNSGVGLTKALAGLSIVMASGRLLAPSVAVGLLWWSNIAPLAFLVMAGLLAVSLMHIFMPNSLASNQSSVLAGTLARTNSDMSVQLDDYLLLIILSLVCAVFSAFTYMLTPILQLWFSLDHLAVSENIAVLMSIAALTMLLCHLLSRKLTASPLFIIFLAILLAGLGVGLMLVSSPFSLLMCTIFISASFALIQLQVTVYLCHKMPLGHKSLATGKVSLFQTLGYGLGAFFLWFADSDIALIQPILAALSLLMLLLLVLLMIVLRVLNRQSRTT